MKRNKLLLSALIMILLCGCRNEACFSEIVRDMGYKADSQAEEIVTVTIPREFNSVYIKYNELQKEGGFDLEPYKGKTCTRYTYLIPSLNARANILVYEGRVIGGDICGITLDGFMLPLRPKKKE